MNSVRMSSRGLLQRLQDGETIIVAEGYLFEFESRCYLQAGAYVPEVVIEHPELVKALYEEFVHAGSDVVLAFTYYGHRAKLQIIGREDDIEKMNRQALKMARQVADETGTLMAGNICNTTVWQPNDKEAHNRTEEIFKEQIQWAVEEGADFIVAETFDTLGESKLALECIKKYGKGVPAVVTLAPRDQDYTMDGYTYADCLRQLDEAGAAVVGLNCHFGLDTMLEKVCKLQHSVKCPFACLPVPFRTHATEPSMQTLTDPKTGKKAFPEDLSMWLCSRTQIADFTKELQKLGVKYMGLCCGNRAHYIRTMAETVGRQPPASRFSPNMKQHLSHINDEDHYYAYQVYNERFGLPFSKKS